MCRAFEEVRIEAKAEGITEGITEGKKEGKEEERIANVRNLMESLKITALQAMDLLKISSSEQKELLAKI